MHRAHIVQREEVRRDYSQRSRTARTIKITRACSLTQRLEAQAGVRYKQGQ